MKFPCYSACREDRPNARSGLRSSSIAIRGIAGAMCPTWEWSAQRAPTWRDGWRKVPARPMVGTCPAWRDGWRTWPAWRDGWRKVPARPMVGARAQPGGMVGATYALMACLGNPIEPLSAHNASAWQDDTRVRCIADTIPSCGVEKRSLWRKGAAFQRLSFARDLTFRRGLSFPRGLTFRRDLTSVGCRWRDADMSDIPGPQMAPATGTARGSGGTAAGAPPECQVEYVVVQTVPFRVNEAGEG